MASKPEIVDAFREAAIQGGRVVARRQGDAWEIETVGRSGTGSGVARLGRDPGSASTADLLVEGLRQFYGDPIGGEVSRQLGLRDDGDNALDARQVLGALEMASASQQVFAGLNFISRHAISARELTPQFRVVCMAIGVRPDRIPQAKCLKADEIFLARFDKRTDGDRRSVDLIEARILMAEVLAQILDEE